MGWPSIKRLNLPNVARQKNTSTRALRVSNRYGSPLNVKMRSQENPKQINDLCRSEIIKQMQTRLPEFIREDKEEDEE